MRCPNTAAVVYCPDTHVVVVGVHAWNGLKQGGLFVSGCKSLLKKNNLLALHTVAENLAVNICHLLLTHSQVVTLLARSQQSKVLPKLHFSLMNTMTILCKSHEPDQNMEDSYRQLTKKKGGGELQLINPVMRNSFVSRQPLAELSSLRGTSHYFKLQVLCTIFQTLQWMNWMNSFFELLPPEDPVIFVLVV